jgi:hypothetical protein
MADIGKARGEWERTTVSLILGSWVHRDHRGGETEGRGAVSACDEADEARSDEAYEPRCGPGLYKSSSTGTGVSGDVCLSYLSLTFHAPHFYKIRTGKMGISVTALQSNVRCNLPALGRVGSVHVPRQRSVPLSRKPSTTTVQHTPSPLPE